MPEDRSEWNSHVIDEFRANSGVVGGFVEGRRLLLLNHIGARSGIAYTTPVACFDYQGGWAIVASNAGQDHHPSWYYNVLAHPRTTIEVTQDGTLATVDVRATVVDANERDQLFAHIKTVWPLFANYEKATERLIPVLILEQA